MKRSEWLVNTNIKTPSLFHAAGLRARPHSMSCDFRADGLGTKNKSLKFLEDPRFQLAWARTAADIKKITGGNAPDVRWRASIALWAAQHGLARDGDFVECGVFTGIFSKMICAYLDPLPAAKRFWLFDTWAGIPTDGIDGGERKTANGYNKDYHRQDIFEAVSQSFAPYPSCRLVRGLLPATLARADIEKIAYLSIDLNNSAFEKSCIEALWPKLSPGAIVVIDDYNFTICRPQQDMWDDFAAAQGRMVAGLPTGQGVLIK